MDTNYHNDYTVLGIQPGCTWVELRLAYRRLVRAWHPDQRRSGPDPIADERIQEINASFRRLAEFYRRHGELPLADDIGGVADSGVAPSPSGMGEHDRFGPLHAAAMAPKRWRTGLRFVLIGSALALGYAVIVNLLHDGPSSTDETASSPRGAVRSTQEHEDAIKPKSISYFRPGSSIGEVIAAQGPPTRIDGNVWHYGESRVYFRDGRVTHWDHNENDPLNVQLVAGAPTPSTAKTFGLGSTKEDVRAAQGIPVLETDTMWDYGASRVHFKDGKVSGWEESLLRPLHVRR